MSKSLGNMVFVKDLYSMGVNGARICLLSQKYGQTWTFDKGAKHTAVEQGALFSQVWRHQSGLGASLDPKPYEQRFYEAMDDDLDTPKALEVMLELAVDILSDSSRDVSDAKGLLSRACNVLGLVIQYGT